MTALDYLVDCLFIIDFALNFFTAYFDEYENLVVDRPVRLLITQAALFRESEIMLRCAGDPEGVHAVTRLLPGHCLQLAG